MIYKEYYTIQTINRKQTKLRSTQKYTKQVEGVEETGVPGENYRLPQITDKLFNIMLYQEHLS